MTLFDSGIIPVINNHLLEESKKVRDYGNYWSASSAGYCNRRLIFERLKIPYVTEDARKQRVFSSGHVFHEWIQKITKDAGLSIAQELELQDEELMIRGHVDDLVLLDGKLMLYDFKTAHSKWFEYAKKRPVSYYNRMQVGTYMYMLQPYIEELPLPEEGVPWSVTEARVLKISKDDLRLHEYQVLWTKELEAEVLTYWTILNSRWGQLRDQHELPPCTCHEHENGFLAKEAWNPYFYEGEPCSEVWFKEQLNKETT